MFDARPLSADSAVSTFGDFVDWRTAIAVPGLELPVRNETRQ